MARRSSARRGFTLLEVLVATVLMAVAITGLLSNLTASTSNAAKLTERDRAVLLAKRRLDALLTEKMLPKGIVFEGLFTPEQSGGVPAGWRARAAPVEWRQAPGVGQPALERIEVQVWWGDEARRKTFRVDGYRMITMREMDVVAAQQGVGMAPVF